MLDPNYCECNTLIPDANLGSVRPTRLLSMISMDLISERNEALAEAMLALVDPEVVERQREWLTQIDRERAAQEAERAAKAAANGPSDEERWEARRQAGEERWNAILDAGLRDRIVAWRPDTEIPDLETGRWLAFDPACGIVGVGVTAAEAIGQATADLVTLHATGEELWSAFGDNFERDVVGTMDDYVTTLTLTFLRGPAGIGALLARMQRMNEPLSEYSGDTSDGAARQEDHDVVSAPAAAGGAA